MKQSLKMSVSLLLVSLFLLLSACSPADQPTNESTTTGAPANANAEQTTQAEGSEDTEAQTIEATQQGETPDSSVLRIGVLFNPSDSLDPATVTSPGGMVLSFYVYDTLAMMTDNGLKLSLAKSITPNDKADAFTVVLNDNVKYSDGSEVTGRDIIDSLKYFSTSPNYQSMYGNVDFENCTADGKTAVIKLMSPAADFAISSLGMFSPVAPKGEFKGIGAGPFIIKEGDPGTGYSLMANEDYHAGTPAIKEVQLLPVLGSAAQANALLTGEIDYAWGLDAAAIKMLNSAENIVIPESTLDSALAKDLVLNTRVAPFNDPEVRKAAKLTIDREKMVNTLLGESGEIGNDMLGKGYKTYPDDIAQTTANKEEAQRIFTEKGITEFTIVASDIVPGMVAAAEFMAQEFAEVGVNVEIKEVDPQSFFAQMAELYQAQAFTFYWMNRPPMAEFRSQILKDSPYNVSGYYSDLTEEQFKLATSNTDEKVQAEAIAKISADIHDNGGEIIWGFQKQLAAHRKGLEGVLFSQSIPWIADATFVPEN